MQFTPPLIEGRLVLRYKRFLADIELGGETITAHCANPGAMAGLKTPGSRIWVSKAPKATYAKRKLKYDWQLIELGSGARVGINTAQPNRIAREALEAGQIRALTGYESLRSEVKYGRNSRIDFLLEDTQKPPCYVEVKSVTLSRENGLAQFPGSVTTRGLKHLQELSLIAQSGQRAVMLYIAQRDDCTRFSPAADIDPEYALGLTLAIKAGVEVLVYDCVLSLTEIRLGKPLIFTP
jgi:sugar fermentation stimulation protein A